MVTAMKRTVRLALASSLLLAVAACETAAPPPPPPPPGNAGPPSANVFRPADFSWSAVPGKGRIDGKLTFRNGQVTILYNSPNAAALPADEVRARTPSAPNGDYSAFVRRTTCDANNRFNFQGLANGAWFVITVAKPIGGGVPDMAIMRRVEIRAGKAVNVEL